jgi:hypothetical protein
MKGARYHCLDLGQPCLRIGRDVEGEDAFAPHHGQRAVARHLRPALSMGEVVGELGACVLLGPSRPEQR